MEDDRGARCGNSGDARSGGKSVVLGSGDGDGGQRAVRSGKIAAAKLGAGNRADDAGGALRLANVARTERGAWRARKSGVAFAEKALSIIARRSRDAARATRRSVPGFSVGLKCLAPSGQSAPTIYRNRRITNVWRPEGSRANTQEQDPSLVDKNTGDKVK